jgi:hypothetical protein
MPLMSPSPPLRICRRHRLSVLALASTVLLGGCSDTPITAGTETTASVASIPRTGTTPATTKPVAVEGPLIRHDTSEAEIARFYQVYSNCLAAEGVPMQKGKAGISQDPETLARYKTELTACAAKRPESVAERDQRQNPEDFPDHLRQWVSCMKSKGLDVVVIPPDGWGISDEAAARGYVPDFRVVQKCQLKVFGD